MGWRFEFDNAYRRFGRCDYAKKRITISRVLTEKNNYEEVRDTLLHEIAHSLLSPSEGHGPTWKRLAVTLGARPEREYGEEVLPGDPKWRFRCPNCKNVDYRYRRKRNLYCGLCWRRAGMLVDLQWEKLR